MDACDPNANVDDLKRLIKLNTGIDIKLTKKEICQAYQDIQDGKLPLPPMIMNSTRTYLVDKRSPLKPSDYELLFDVTTKRADLKRIARKVDLKKVEQMTKSQIVDAIGAIPLRSERYYVSLQSRPSLALAHDLKLMVFHIRHACLQQVLQLTIDSALRY